RSRALDGHRFCHCRCRPDHSCLRRAQLARLPLGTAGWTSLPGSGRGVVAQPDRRCSHPDGIPGRGTGCRWGLPLDSGVSDSAADRLVLAPLGRHRRHCAWHLDMAAAAICGAIDPGPAARHQSHVLRLLIPDAGHVEPDPDDGDGLRANAWAGDAGAVGRLRAGWLRQGTKARLGARSRLAVPRCSWGLAAPVETPDRQGEPGPQLGSQDGVSRRGLKTGPQDGASRRQTLAWPHLPRYVLAARYELLLSRTPPTMANAAARPSDAMNHACHKLKLEHPSKTHVTKVAVR